MRTIGIPDLESGSGQKRAAKIVKSVPLILGAIVIGAVVGLLLVKSGG